MFFSAACVGFLHSLMPSHWLPVVLLARSQRWTLGKSLLAAAIGASGHLFFSLLLGMGVFLGEAFFLTEYEEPVEHFLGFLLLTFGLIYSILCFFQHLRCRGGHTHHGPDPRKMALKGPWIFLFSVGLFPCVAALPIFLAAGTQGWATGLLSLIGFSLGVLASFLFSTFCALTSLLKMDLPLFEHYGDVLSGAAVALAGILLLCSPW